jgi:hypothetical protein
MRATLTVLFLAGSILGCSASENANHSIRCDSTTLCPDQRVCYREFCIPDQGLPQLDLDAAGIAVEPSQDDARVRQPADRPGSTDARVGVVDASADSDATSSLGNGEDAQSGPAVPPAEVPPTQVPNPPVTPPEQGPTTPPTTPVVDAGAVVADAGQNNAAANRALLIVCLPSCSSNRSPACYACLSGVLSRNPEVCAEAEGVDPLISGMCDFLCTTAACRGRR